MQVLMEQSEYNSNINAAVVQGRRTAQKELGEILDACIKKPEMVDSVVLGENVEPKLSIFFENFKKLVKGDGKDKVEA